MHWIDPASLPETRGTVAKFLYNAHGDADGFLLDGDRQVHLPPHLSSELLRKVKLGDAVQVRGVKPRGADMVAAVSLKGPAGIEIVDHGPADHPKHHQPPKHPKAHRVTKPVEVQSRVQRTLYAPKGEVCGALLDSGEIVRMRPKENAELAPYFEIGGHIAVWGEAFVVRGQKVIDLSEIAFAD